MEQNQNKTRSKWIKPVFIASLAVNLVILGLIIGAAFGDHHRPGRGLKAPHGVRAYVSAMTEDQREEFHERTQTSLAGSLKTLRKLSNRNKMVIAAIEATPFSEDALRSAMDQQATDVSVIMSGFQEELIATLSAMNDEERAEYVARMKEQRKKRWKKRK
ncbi:MAG: periplasmic heavy metal sensor [Rhodobacteraceae bacterium]|nr:periplasmic heavy metal sensor [Paracoccaceae bacterium]